MNTTNETNQFLISTNADGCLVGNYCAELILGYNEAVKILKRVRRGDPDAKLFKIQKESEVK